MAENKLAIIIKEQELSTGSAKQLMDAFNLPLVEAGEILDTYKQIAVTSVDDTASMALAREKRLALKKARVAVENKRKELKGDIVKQGRAIDSVATFVKQMIEPAEEYLLLQEKYAENLAAQEAEAKARQRIETLLPLVNDISMFNVDTMTDEQFDALVAERVEAQRLAKEALDRAEADRVAKEKAEQAERERVAAENAQLKADAEAAAAKAAQEAADRKAADELAAAEQAKKDAAAEAERKRLQDIADAKQAEIDRIAYEKQAEADRVAAAEEAARVEAANQAAKAAAAPDKEKLLAYASAIENATLPVMVSTDGQAIVLTIKNNLETLVEFIKEEAGAL